MEQPTTSNTTTGASKEQDIERNFSHMAPLLPSYSTSCATNPDVRDSPPPRAAGPQVWRRMTGGLTGGKKTGSKVTDLQRVYNRKNLFVAGQWFFTFWVLGVTARSLYLAGKSKHISPTPLLVFPMVCVSNRSSYMGYYYCIPFYTARPDVCLYLPRKLRLTLAL